MEQPSVIKFASETAKCRERLLPFCVGRGVDLGCGTIEKICQEAIGVDARPGVADHIGPIDSLAFSDGSLDYIFSSHALEHLPFPVAALTEWIRVLRPGGMLVLYLPHKDFYRQYNPEHFWNPTPEMVTRWCQDAAGLAGRVPTVVHEFLDTRPDCYSFDLVMRMD